MVPQAREKRELQRESGGGGEEVESDEGVMEDTADCQHQLTAEKSEEESDAESKTGSADVHEEVSTWGYISTVC